MLEGIPEKVSSESDDLIILGTFKTHQVLTCNKIKERKVGVLIIPKS